ncbi:hypothetical protein E0Z10_g8743 [Xylaria hypoxylon]|uniref:Uncharacterized protein n=1 Tax=Xylaria hypoxylon TaxID=37992 RepID=A0A4Z0YLF6_9PEZI|nr:hypothetical protein E0Z10_g8743 [Xylaria hypoxylon]
MMRVITSVAVLALAFLGRVDAGLVLKAPRTEIPGLLSGHVFVTPVPIPVAATTTVLPAISTATSTSGEIPSDVGTGTGTGTAQASNPETTAAPPLDLGDGQKFVQTTYWACATFPSETHCGWHEPILDASSAGMKVRGGSVTRTGGVAACVIAALVLVL